MTVLSDIELRLDRAEEHLDAIGAEIRAGVEAHVPTTPSQRNELDDSYSATLEEVPEVRREWGVWLGDFLHNTRSALDHCVAGLVRANGGTVGTHHQFPIFDAPEHWEKKVEFPPKGRYGWLDDVAADHWATIQSLQPYQPTTGVKSLVLLRDFSNADKHRLLHGAVTAVTDQRISGEFAFPLTVSEVQFLPPGAHLKAGAEIARYKIDAVLPFDTRTNKLVINDDQVKVHLHMKLTTAFGEAGQEKARVRDFRECLADVRGIVKRFSPDLG